MLPGNWSRLCQSLSMWGIPFLGPCSRRQAGLCWAQVTCSGFAEDWASALGQMGPRWEPPGPGDETIIFGTGDVKGKLGACACKATPAMGYSMCMLTLDHAD